MNHVFLNDEYEESCKDHKSIWVCNKHQGITVNSEGAFPDRLEICELKLASRNKRDCESEYRMDLLVLAV